MLKDQGMCVTDSEDFTVIGCIEQNQTVIYNKVALFCLSSTNSFFMTSGNKG